MNRVLRHNINVCTYELENHKERVKVRSYGPAYSGTSCSCAGLRGPHPDRFVRLTLTPKDEE